MAASANGWRVLDRDQCADLKVPGGVLPVHPALAPIFLDLATRYHDTVEQLQWPGCWGWAHRPIKGTSTFSNHASGTAIDLCAPRHPQGVPVARTFTRGQVAAVGALLSRYHGLIVWGGTWDLPSTDGMHFELAAGATFEQVSALAATLRQHPDPTPAPKPAPKPKPAPSGFTGPDLAGSGLRLRGDQGANGRRVQALQRFLARNYPLYAKHLDDDGWWGPKTATVVREFAHRSGIPSADGRNIGPKIARALMRAGFRG